MQYFGSLFFVICLDKYHPQLFQAFSVCPGFQLELKILLNQIPGLCHAHGSEGRPRADSMVISVHLPGKLTKV